MGTKLKKNLQGIVRFKNLLYLCRRFWREVGLFMGTN